MALAVLLVLMLAMVGTSDGAWCVCKPDASSSNLQKAIDYACGTNANCAPILPGGPCYNPNTAANHCSYAANSYYQKNNQNQQACVFDGTAQLVTTDPSTPGCSFPATPSAAGGSGGGGTAPSTSPPAVPGTSPPAVPGTSPPVVPGTSPPTTPGSSITPPPPGTGFSPGNGTGFTPGPGTGGTGTGTGTGTGGGFGSLGPTGSGFDSSGASGLVPPVAESAAALILASAATVYLLRV